MDKTYKKLTDTILGCSIDVLDRFLKDENIDIYDLEGILSFFYEGAYEQFFKALFVYVVYQKDKYFYGVTYNVYKLRICNDVYDVFTYNKPIEEPLPDVDKALMKAIMNDYEKYFEKDKNKSI